MKGETIDGARHFTCKRCGERIIEPLKSWRKKPQKDKNICQDCLRGREVARQTAREKAYLYGHRYF